MHILLLSKVGRMVLDRAMIPFLGVSKRNGDGTWMEEKGEGETNFEHS